MSLRDRLAAEITQTGPMTVAQYMTACLHDPDFGYYATRPALGEDGDFITAPLISQMFGELIGVWAISAWRAMGAPEAFVLVEIGPGDGTLMSDLLRERLGDAVRWTTTLNEVPGGLPILLIANELLDCLPARQFLRTVTGWAEQVVGLDKNGALGFRLVPASDDLPDARDGVVLERSGPQEALGAALGERLGRDGGAALLIDYGRSEPGFGDTLQALRRHEKVDPLACPGQADLTVHADFPAVMAAARTTGALAAILTQAAFLARLGIGERAEALVRARPDKAALIGRQLNRLVGGDQMGQLFKACCLYSRGWTPPAFEDAVEP